MDQEFIDAVRNMYRREGMPDPKSVWAVDIAPEDVRTLRDTMPSDFVFKGEYLTR